MLRSTTLTKRGKKQYNINLVGHRKMTLHD